MKYKIMAWIFIVLGLIDSANTIILISRNKLIINFGIFLLIIGVGLLFRSEMARIWGRVISILITFLGIFVLVLLPFASVNPFIYNSIILTKLIIFLMLVPICMFFYWCGSVFKLKSEYFK